MTKKHFVAIAAAIKELWENSDNVDAVDEVARAIADVCADSNPRFNRARFLSACR